MGDIDYVERHKRRPRDPALASLASRQHGLVTTRQLRALGFGGPAILRRVEAGRLHIVHRRVYAVGHPGLSFDARCMAAVMAAGQETGLASPAAVALWHCLPPPPEPFDVVSSRRNRRGPDGIVLHRPRQPPELTRIRGIPVLTLPHALLDLAARRPQAELDRAIREAYATGRADHDRLIAFAQQHAPGRPGAPALRQALGLQAGTRSRVERQFLALCRRVGIEIPLRNQRVAGLQVDFHWPQHGLVVETDTFATHGTRHAFERDRQREAILARAGIRTLRFSDTQIERTETVVGDTLRALITVSATCPAGR